MAEKRTLYLEAEKVRLDRLEAFLKDNIDNVKQCAVCNEYFCEEDTMMCEGGGSDTPCYLTLCSAHFARSACGCFAFCARHAAEEGALQNCDGCATKLEKKRRKNFSRKKNERE
jgi:hypothetical protein